MISKIKEFIREVKKLKYSTGDFGTLKNAISYILEYRRSKEAEIKLKGEKYKEYIYVGKASIFKKMKECINNIFSRVQYK